MRSFILIAMFLSLMLSTVSNAASNNSPLTYVHTEQAAKPEGAYTPAITVDLSKGKLVFVSGQIARDPKTGMLRENDIQKATALIFDNIQANLKASGSDLNYVIRMDVFLKDMKDWDAMNSEYIKHFSKGHLPARQTVQVGMDNRIEISCIAFVPTT